MDSEVLKLSKSAQSDKVLKCLELVNTNFEDCFEYVTYEHYKTCDCKREEYEKYALEVLNNYKKVRYTIDKKKYFENSPNSTVEEFESSRNEELLERAYSSSYEESIRKIAYESVRNNIRCFKEKKEVLNTVKLFIEKYPDSIDDPIFIEIVKSVINHQLTVHRLKKVSSQLGVITRWTDRNDNERISVSPLLEAQREFDKVKVDALMLLDKKLNGEKSVSVNITTEPIPIEELYSKLATYK